MQHYARHQLAGKGAATAPSVALLSRIWDTNTGNHAVTFTPAVGDTLVAFVAATGYNAITISENQGGTWQLIESAYKNGTTDMFRLYIRNEKVTSAVSHTVTGSMPTCTGGGIAVFALKNMTNTGINAIRQSTYGSGFATGTPSLTLGKACLTTNIVMGFTFGASTVVHKSGYTEHYDESYNTPSTSWEAMSITTGETATTITWGGSETGPFAACVVEFNCSTVGLDIAPNTENASGTAGSYTFGTFTVTVTGGTATAWNWSFLGSAGGTFAINSGQGTASAVPRVTGVADPGQAYAYLVCDVTVGGIVHSTRTNTAISYDRDSGGCVAVTVVSLLAEEEE